MSSLILSGAVSINEGAATGREQEEGMKPIPDLIPVIRNQQSERISKVYQVGGSKGAGMNANIFLHCSWKNRAVKKNNDTNKKKVKRSLRASLVSSRGVFT